MVGLFWFLLLQIAGSAEAIDCDNVPPALAAHQVGRKCLAVSSLALPASQRDVFCEKVFGGRLAVLKTEAEFNASIIVTQTKTPGGWPMVGLFENDAGEWYWSDGTPLDLHVTPWANGEGTGPSSEKAAFIKTFDVEPYGLGDISEVSFPAMCEFDNARATSPLKDQVSAVGPFHADCQQLNGVILGPICYFATSTIQLRTSCAQTLSTIRRDAHLARVWSNDILQALGTLLAPVSCYKIHFLQGKWFATAVAGDASNGWHLEGVPAQIASVSGTVRAPLANILSAVTPDTVVMGVGFGDHGVHFGGLPANANVLCIGEFEHPGQFRQFVLTETDKKLEPNNTDSHLMTVDVAREMKPWHQPCAFYCAMQLGCLSYNVYEAGGLCELLSTKSDAIEFGLARWVDASQWAYYERLY